MFLPEDGATVEIIKSGAQMIHIYFQFLGQQSVFIG